MTELDRTLVRKLAEWSPGELPVTTVYLSVDGSEYPRKQDYELRLEEVLRSASDRAAAVDREANRSVQRDVEEIRSFVRGRFERKKTRGLALYSCSGAGLWEDVAVSRPVRNMAAVGPHPDLLQLERLLEVYESFCTVLVDSEKARIFLAELGRIEEQRDLVDDVPNQHKQGGWSQARYERHVEDHRQRHLKHVAEVLLRFHKRRSFDHLIVGGPQEVTADFDKELHDYLRQRILATVNLSMHASADEVLARSLECEEELDRGRVREAVEQIVAESAAGRQAVAGLGPTLRALGENRVGTLVASMDLRTPGRECPSCGRLAVQGKRCNTCGAQTREVPDVVEAAVIQALRQGARVETATEEPAFAERGGVGALLRF
jgi:peptide chain release factor subunit 1